MGASFDDILLIARLPTSAQHAHDGRFIWYYVEKRYALSALIIWNGIFDLQYYIKISSRWLLQNLFIESQKSSFQLTEKNDSFIVENAFW